VVKASEVRLRQYLFSIFQRFNNDNDNDDDDDDDIPWMSTVRLVIIKALGH